MISRMNAKRNWEKATYFCLRVPKIFRVSPIVMTLKKTRDNPKAIKNLFFLNSFFLNAIS